MKRLMLTLGALLALGLTAYAEFLPPVPIGGSNGSSGTLNANGQSLRITATGSIEATVYFVEVTAGKVSGMVVRTSTGSTAGTIKIEWVSQHKSTNVYLSGATPEVLFSIEGGDGDKRTGDIFR